MATIQHRFLTSWGYQLVEENHLLIVLRHGRYHRLVGPGYVWLNPLYEEARGPIFIGFQSARYHLTVQSGDGLAVGLDVSALFSFDPRQAHDNYVAPIALGSAQSSAVLASLIGWHLEPAMRAACAMSAAIELCRGANGPEIAARVRRDLAQSLLPFGLRLPCPAGLNITRVQPPAALQDAAAWASYRALMGAGFNTPPDEVDKLLVQWKLHEQMAASGNTIYVIAPTGMQEMISELHLPALHPGQSPGHRQPPR